MISATLAAAILVAEQSHGIPPRLLEAVILAESGGRWQVSHERQGGCSVGPAQVYFHDCTRRHRPRELSAHLDRAAYLLARSHRVCLSHPAWRACRLSRDAWGTGLYNAGSATWGPKVATIWRRLRRAPTAPQPEVI